MGYALKLPNVNFASVSIGKVNYVEEIPCTDITLSASTITVDSAEDTATLTASLTPSNTTDAVIWSSSDELVASVANGVVTVHGIGSAIITATCGEQSATCQVIQSSIKAEYPFLIIQDKYASTVAVSNEYILALSPDNAASTGGQAYHNVDSLRVRNSVNEVECVRVPYGSTKMRFGTTDGNEHSINMVYIVDTESILTDDGINYPAYVSRPTFVKSTLGCDVVYGQAVIFRAPPETMAYVDHIFFE